jgi:hypothetical protein
MFTNDKGGLGTSAQKLLQAKAESACLWLLTNMYSIRFLILTYITQVDYQVLVVVTIFKLFSSFQFPINIIREPKTSPIPSSV